LGARWYSSEPEVKKEEETKDASSSSVVEDALKVEMEKKDREIIDLKVCSSSSFHHPNCNALSFP